MIIRRNEIDKNYTFKICGGYGDIDVTLQDLKELKKQIDKILKKEERK